jgi:hypothetical protein
VLGATAALTGSADLTVRPTFEMHFDRVFTYNRPGPPAAVKRP